MVIKVSKEILEGLSKALIEGKEEEAKSAAQKAVDTGIPVFDLIKEMEKAMGVVGQKFSDKEYFLSELVESGNAMKAAIQIIEPHIKPGEIEATGKVVFGTVYEDLHDIGKNMVVSALIAAGFEVHDLGVDVPPEKFVEAVKKHNPDILAMSALMGSTVPNMQKTVKALEENGLRDKVRIMVGGAPILQWGQRFADMIGADYFGKDPLDGVKVAEKIMKGIKEEA